MDETGKTAAAPSQEEAKSAVSVPSEGIAERALAGKSAWKPVVVIFSIFLGLIAAFLVHFYLQGQKPGDIKKKLSTLGTKPGSEKQKVEPGYANLEMLLPLKEGTSWEYINVRTMNGRTYEVKNIVTFLNVREIKGKRTRCVRHDFIRTGAKSNNNSFIYLFYVVENDSIYIFARQSIEGDEPTVYSLPIYVIKTPIKVGTSWKNRGHAGVIESINETVSVPAGTFSGCIRTKVTFKKNVTIGWIAPGIGFVKKIFQYGDDDQSVEQLVSYKK